MLKIFFNKKKVLSGASSFYILTTVDIEQILHVYFELDSRVDWTDHWFFNPPTGLPGPIKGHRCDPSI